MPWTVKDVERHNKGLSAREKRQWCHVANGALESGDDDGTAITKANGVVKKGRIVSQAEALLYKKASRLIELVRMQEIASLMEADPRPRVEFDIDGKSVLPTRQQYTQYFQDMQAKYIKAAVDQAHDLWKSAKADEKKALDLEIEVGNEVLNTKSVTEAAKKKPTKKPVEITRTGKALHTGVDIASGGSPMASMIAGHLAKWLFKAK
jgi:uncharacterized protein YdaT